MKLPSYPKVWNLGHPAVKDLLDGPVVVQEKVDGSQISFGLIEGELHIRSKGAEIHPDAPDSLFSKAVEVIKTLPLIEGAVYRGEYLSKPKHNTLAYDRVPRRHIILFDIQLGVETYFPPVTAESEAWRVGLEVVPSYIKLGPVTKEEIQGFLESTSVLGGQKVEGVVIKNYDRYGVDGKVLMGKHVSEAFKEIHGQEWKASNPKQGDVVQQIIEKVRTPARWAKAVQHLRERGELTDSPKDIGALIREVPADLLEEMEPEMKEWLWKWAWPKIQRGATAGVAEWYKGQLFEKQFEGEEP